MWKVVNTIAAYCGVISFVWIAFFQDGEVLQLNEQAQRNQLTRTESAIVQAKELGQSETVWVVRSISSQPSVGHYRFNLESEEPYGDDWKHRAVTLWFRSNLQPSAEQFEDLECKDRLKLKFAWRPTFDPTNPTSYLDPEKLPLIPTANQ